MILGVIGGLGPIATAYFMELVTKMTKAEIDQEHLEMIIHSCPRIPDRTGYILNQSNESPLAQMIEVGKKLSKQGADVIAIPCITAHYFHEELEKGIGLPIINAIQETALCLKAKNINKVGLYATDGTISSRIFQEKLSEQGIETILPSEKSQKIIMKIIYDNVKSGKAVDIEEFFEVSNQLKLKGVQNIILGCTELSLIKRDYNIGEGYLDAMEVLAKEAICRCGGEIKESFKLF